MRAFIISVLAVLGLMAGCAFPAGEVREAAGHMGTAWGIYQEHTVPSTPEAEAARLQVTAGLSFFEVQEDGPHAAEAAALAGAWATYRDGAPPRRGLSEGDLADLATLRNEMDVTMRLLVEVER